jgi:putative FmdB family regulatory protein
MPMFEYACPRCGHVFERLVLSRNAEPPECPQCGWKRVEQKFSAFASVGGSKSTGASCAPSGSG